MTKKLTKIMIDQANYEGDPNGKTRYFLWDTEIPGFGLRIYPSGRKAFVLSYRINGQKRLMAIADYGVFTLDQARKGARLFLAEVTKGQDPLAERQKKARGETVKDLCDQYIEKWAKPRKKSWEEDERRLNKYILPAWRNHKVRAIRHQDAVHLRHKIGNRSKYEANRCVSLISKMWEFGRSEGFIDRTDDNPARGIEKYPERKRNRWVTQDEMPRLIKAIQECDSVYVRALLWMYLFTGCRKTELITAKWEYVDFTRNELNLPDTKSGEPLHLPLSAPAISVLRALPREKDNPYIFVGRVHGKHLVNPYKVWKSIRDKAEVSNLTLHDIRRTVGSWLKQAGNDTYLVQHILNHKDSRTTERYMQFAQDHLRAPLERHAQTILTSANKDESSATSEGSHE